MSPRTRTVKKRKYRESSTDSDDSDYSEKKAPTKTRASAKASTVAIKVFTAEEEVQLAKLYFEHFTIFNSPRYEDDDYLIPESNLHKYLLDEWARKLSAKSHYPKTADDVLQKLKTMLREVEEYRLMSTDITSCTGLVNNAAFSIVNHVVDLTHIEHPKVEKWLDKYEEFLVENRNEDSPKKWKLAKATSKAAPKLAAPRLPPTVRKQIIDLYKENAINYNKATLRKSHIPLKVEMLEEWSKTISAGQVTAAEVAVTIEHYRKYDMKQGTPSEDDVGEESEGESKQDVERKTRSQLTKRNVEPEPSTSRRRAEASPKSAVDVYSIHSRPLGFLLFSAQKRQKYSELYNERHFDVVSGHIYNEWKKRTNAERERYEDVAIATDATRTRKIRDIVGPELTNWCFEEELQIGEQASLEVTLLRVENYQQRLLDCMPKFDFCASSSGVFSMRKRFHELEEYPSSKSTSTGQNSRYRTNRASMTRAERHLLGLLYRRFYVEFEGIGAPRKMWRKNRMFYLQLFAQKISTLGVADRETDEIATKIGQYKSNMRYRNLHKSGQLGWASDYKMKQCTRPMTPITQLFDISDTPMTEITDADIDLFINDWKESEKYPRDLAKQLKEEDNSDDLLESNPTTLVSEIVAGPPLDLNQSNGLPFEDQLAAITATTTVKQEVNDEDDETFKNPSHSSHVEPPVFTSPTLAGFTVKEIVQNDILEMEGGGPNLLVYDVVGVTGNISRMAVTREISERGDVNYFIWSRFLEMNAIVPMTMYVCAKCELMSQYKPAPGARSKIVSKVLSSGHLLSQQSLPAVVIDDVNLTSVGIRWNRPPPRHRCVPFLNSTLCEKFSEMAHFLVRYHPQVQPLIPHTDFVAPIGSA